MEIERDCLSEVNVMSDDYTKILNRVRDAEKVKQFKIVLEDLREEGKADKEDVCTAYRWLVLRQAELEDQMTKILHQGDIELYFKIRQYELSKMADTLRINYYVPLEHLDSLVAKHQVMEDTQCLQFTSELE